MSDVITIAVGKHLADAKKSLERIEVLMAKLKRIAAESK